MVMAATAEQQAATATLPSTDLSFPSTLAGKQNGELYGSRSSYTTILSDDTTDGTDDFADASDIQIEWNSLVDQSRFLLHKAAFENDLPSLRKLLSNNGEKNPHIALKDKHGNTALHLAAVLGYRECIELLLEHEAPVATKNLAGQTPLNEAVGFGSRRNIMMLYKAMRSQNSKTIESHRPEIQKALNTLDDFELTLKWEFHSWMPLVSRFLPSDVCTIYKKGCKIRMNTTLIDFKDMKWERGDLSFLFDGARLGDKSLLVMDHDRNEYQYIQEQAQTSSDDEDGYVEHSDDDVDLLMMLDNETGKISTKEIECSKASSGIIFRQNKKESVAGYMADFYNIKGIKVHSLKRREHLSEADVKRNKQSLMNIKNSLTDGETDPTTELERRHSIPPPPECIVLWDEYFNAEPGKPPHLGRPLKCKRRSKNFHATAAMSEEFPITVPQILTILESIRPLSHFKKLREFLTLKLPPGFPVKLEIPVFPTVSAKVAFEKFKKNNKISDDKFRVPSNYTENPKRFDGL